MGSGGGRGRWGGGQVLHAATPGPPPPSNAAANSHNETEIKTLRAETREIYDMREASVCVCAVWGQCVGKK